MKLSDKILATYLGVAGLIIILFSTMSYVFLRHQLLGGLQDRLRNIADVAAPSIDITSLQKVLCMMSPDMAWEKLDGSSETLLPEKVIYEFETSDPDYAAVSDRLNAIRESQPDLIVYAYIFVPTASSNAVRFVVDADVLESIRAEKETGKKDESVSHLSRLFDISTQEDVRRLLQLKKSYVSEKFIYDDDVKSFLISGFSPVRDAEGHIMAYLGLDISIASAGKILNRALFFFVMLGVVSIAVVFIVSMALSRSLTRPLITLHRGLRDIADGSADLTRTLTIETNDEIGDLAASFNSFSANLREYINLIKALSYNLKETTDSISSGLLSVEKNIEEQATLGQRINERGSGLLAYAHDISANVETESRTFSSLFDKLSEISVTIVNLSESAARSMTLVDSINRRMKEGNSSLRYTGDVMEKIAGGSREMTGIVEIINDISDQINLLSLNAAIESARAGDAGRGFAVVADSIASLADKTSANIAYINKLIAENVGSIDEALKSLRTTDDVITRMDDELRQISGIIAEISDFMTEQQDLNRSMMREKAVMKEIEKNTGTIISGHSEVVEGISRDIADMAEMSRDNTAALEEVAASTRDMAESAGGLYGRIEHFKV